MEPIHPLKHWMSMYPGKFASEDKIFGNIHTGETGYSSALPAASLSTL